MILTTCEKHNAIARSIPERLERLAREGAAVVHAHKTVNNILLERRKSKG